MQAKIVLEYSDEKTAEAVAKAVSPDNLKTPKDLSIKTTKDSRKVVTSISYEGKFATFIATIDDLLFSASTAERTILMAKRLE
ncbi:MAG TPA: KEOPS complex subunit Pcc1 [Candidatus Eisenbacteria bacterium]|nr:KEOPS complex subunit Pcc1 [Candidatus Eisenbacteria bacterium]